MGAEVKIIDTGLAVAKQVARELKKFSLQNKSNEKNYSIFTNSQNLKMEAIIRSMATNSDFDYSYHDSWN